MKGALIILIVLIITGIILYLLDIRTHHNHSSSSLNNTTNPQPETCCGLHALCEKKYSNPTDSIVYYDDEELDALKDRDPNSYSEHELNMIREVLSTLRPSDALGWARSLDLRNIRLTPALRDELIILIEESQVSSGA